MDYSNGRQSWKLPLRQAGAHWFAVLQDRLPPEALGSPVRRPRPDPGSTGRGHGRSARRRQRVAGARLQGQERRSVGDTIDPGVVSLVAELRGHERHAAEELEQWKTIHEERKTVDARLLYRAARVVTSAEASSRCRATALTSSNGKSPLPWTDTVDGARPAALLPGLLLERSFLLRALFLL